MSVVWHDLECGAYRADLALWRELARSHGDPILDIGAGTGRVALELARAGHSVTALDSDPELLAELRNRAGDLPLHTVLADARSFELDERFLLCLVPMQTIQLLGGSDGRLAFLNCARRHLRTGGVLAIAITQEQELELFELRDGESLPLPDMDEIDGVVYSSQPTAVRREGDGFVLERRRETVSPAGDRVVTDDAIHLDGISAALLTEEAKLAGLHQLELAQIAPTPDHVGSEVVILGV